MDKKSNIPMTFYWEGGEKDSILIPGGFREAIKSFLEAVHKHSGYKCSRNEFILKAIRHYLDHLLSQDNTKKMVKVLEEKGEARVKSDTNPPPTEPEKGR